MLTRGKTKNLKSSSLENSDANDEEKNHNSDGKATEKMFSCQYCCKEFTERGKLTWHVRKKHGGQTGKFVCGICGLQFISKYNLHRHSLQVHEKRKAYKCEFCPAVVADRAKLNIHMRSHTGETPFACNICHKAFKSISLLKRHELIHSGVKKWLCKFCFKRFTQSSSLKDHLSRIHSQANEQLVQVHLSSAGELPAAVRCHLRKIGFLGAEGELPYPLCSFVETERMLSNTDIWSTTSDDEEEYSGDSSQGEEVMSCLSGEQGSTQETRLQETRLDLADICFPLQQDMASQREQLADMKSGRYGHDPRVICVLEDGSLVDMTLRYKDNLPTQTVS